MPGREHEFFKTLIALLIERVELLHFKVAHHLYQ